MHITPLGVLPIESLFFFSSFSGWTSCLLHAYAKIGQVNQQVRRIEKENTSWCFVFVLLDKMTVMINYSNTTDVIDIKNSNPVTIDRNMEPKLLNQLG